jgi:prolyl-tRNA synthetase
MTGRLDAYHHLLVARAQAYRDEHSADVDDLEAFDAQVAHGFASALHCGRPECEASIQDRTRATPRCVPVEGADETGACIACGRPSAYGRRVVFARAY